MATSSAMIVEGSVFLVPLGDSGYARGVLARTSGKGTAFGYFFGPRLVNRSAATLEGLSPKKAILVAKFGDHGLHKGQWPVIGKLSSWDRSFWVLPKFSREHDQKDQRYLVTYDDKMAFISEDIVPARSREIEGLPYDSMLGSAIVETRLQKILLGGTSAD